jgi:hypothetical protein
MTEASVYLLELAARNAQAYTTLPQTRAAMVTGSAAEGLSDFYSDIDMTIYYEELPAEEELHAARRRNQGSERIWLLGDREDGGFAEAYLVKGVECQIGHVTIANWERDMATVMEQLEVQSPLQKALSGTLDCLPLYGETLIQQWKDRIADYPDALAQAMVEKHLQFFPVWFLQERFLVRDATLWLHQIRVESIQNIFGVLAGLNRLYYSTFQFKRMHAFLRKMKIAPDNLADRIEWLLQADPQNAVHLLESLVTDTVALVAQHMPQVDTSTVQKRLGLRQQVWQPQPASP